MEKKGNREKRVIYQELKKIFFFFFLYIANGKTNFFPYFPIYPNQPRFTLNN